jgi:hypothetical protein
MLLQRKDFGDLPLAEKYKYLEKEMKRLKVPQYAIEEALAEKEESVLGSVNACLLSHEKNKTTMASLLHWIHRALTDI